jgi:hypothetical protein
MSDYIQKWALGYKESGSNESGLLGWERKLSDASVENGYILEKTPTDVEVVWCVNTGPAAITPGKAVTLDSGEELLYSVQAVVSAHEVGFGIADPFITGTIAVGDKFNVIRYGVIPVYAGEALAKGAAIGVGSTGNAVASGVPYGVMLEAATESGQEKRARVDFRSSAYTQNQSVTADDSDSSLNQITPSATRVVVAGVTNDANDYVILPALASVPVGHEITIIGAAGANFEVRTPAASAEEINSEDCDGTKEYLFTNTQIHRFVKISNTIGWMGQGYTAIGAAVTAVAPD